jgi:hypothetical protein
MTIFRGSFAQLLNSLHTLDAVISDNYPMLASGWLPPFPGGSIVFRWVVAKNFYFGYSIVSFLSGFILTLYP